MADQSATAVYDPAKTDPSQLVSAFAEAKSAGESRFTLASVSNDADASTEAGSGTTDTSNDFAPPLPAGSPDFSGSGNSEAGAAVSGGDFDVSLEAPAE